MTTSFIHDIEERLIAEINTKLGPSSLVYPTPAYLLVPFVGRAGGRPIPLLEDQQLPGLWIEYLAGQPKKYEIGSDLGLATAAVESFNIFGLFRTTPEILGCATDQATFTKEAEAAAGTLLRRLMLVLAEFDPSVTDALLGYKTNGQRLGGWAYNGVTRGLGVIDYTLMVRYDSQVVI
jgi:hypothetical protein